MITRKSKFSASYGCQSWSKVILASFGGNLRMHYLIFSSESSFSRLENLSLRQEEEKVEKIERWELWIIRIRKLQDQCQQKTEALRSTGEPKNKKEADDQMILIKVSQYFSGNVRVNQDYIDWLIGKRAAHALCSRGAILK